MMHILWLCLLLTPTVANNCDIANQLECLTTLCYNYYFVNSTCTLNSSSHCQPGQVPYPPQCITCSALSSSNCSSLCPDYVWVSSVASGGSGCVSCNSLFGGECVRCTTVECLECAYSSCLALAADGKSCVNNSCAVSFCVICYQAGSKCYTCQKGFVTDNTSQCLSASCSVQHCMSCAASLCSSCFPGYQLSPDALTCQPLCNDLYCTNCIAPLTCSTCALPYELSNRICSLNCSQISVANCQKCLSDWTCIQCSVGFSLVGGGTFCQLVCLVSNCQYCFGDSSLCLSCLPGYNLNNNTCSLSFCSISYCQTCLSLGTCSICINGFSLSGDKLTCSSNCPSAGLVNCLFCNSTGCLICVPDYNLSGGQCQLPCLQISRCRSCHSSTLCSSCSEGYELSGDYLSCDVVCRVLGCVTCQSSSSVNCTSCLAGYTLFLDSLSKYRCGKDCQRGEVNTGSAGIINCQVCSITISFCQSCSYLSSAILCTSCLEGYFLNGFNCDLCSQAISGCLTCQSVTYCQSCSGALKLVSGLCLSGTCDPTIINCYACAASNVTQCVECNPGYSQTLFSGCQLQTCPDTYVLEESTLFCVCPLGSFDKQGVCHACRDDNCLNCTVNHCSSCLDNYYPFGAACYSCPDNCLNCKSVSSCQKCQLGYSFNSQGLCESLGREEQFVVGATGVILKCQAGCRLCLTSSNNSFSTVCTQTSNGYSIIGGFIVRCHPSCKGCLAYLSSICTSCYPRHVLVRGVCSLCTDLNALTCFPHNLGYSLTCRAGYTPTYYASANSSGGSCLSCISNCRHCYTAGPGKCDPQGCEPGWVQVLGTSNCSLCFKGCSQCSASDPNRCLKCGPMGYMNAGGGCSRCQVGCKSCSALANNCISCEVGYYLVSSRCQALPQNCVALSSAGVCLACFEGYFLQPSNSSCTADVRCNSTGSCFVCPDGYYLSNMQCLACSMPSQCLKCSSFNPSLCTRCNQGYYLDPTNNCQTCPISCVSCDSPEFCTQSHPGFYLIVQQSGSITGQVSQCDSGCLTCINFPTLCLSCVPGYFLFGQHCHNNKYLSMNILFGQSPSGNSIFLDTHDPDTQLFSAIQSFSRIGSAIDHIAPSSFKDSRDWTKRLRFRSVGKGSILVVAVLEAGTYNDPDTAANDMTLALSGNSLDGLGYLSSSTVALGFEQVVGSGEGEVSLGLILGLSIPLLVLVLLIFLLLIRWQCFSEDASDSIELMPETGFYSEGKMQFDKGQQQI